MIPSSNSELEDAEIHVEDNSAKEVRWGRKDDKQLFEALRFIQSKYVFDIVSLSTLAAEITPNLDHTRETQSSLFKP